MSNYGYLHLGRVLSYNPTTDSYSLESIGLARTSRWPPVVSCVPGLQPGDKVILAATGTSRDDLKIIGKVGATAPGIGDITGLTAALAAKADDTEITAINGTLTTLDNRLDVVEPLVTAHGLAIGDLALDMVAAESAITTLQSADTTLSARIATQENFADTIESERDLFSDLLSTTPRNGVSAGMTITNGTIYLMRLITRRALSITQIRMATSAIATGPGTAVAGVYGGAALTAMTLLGSAGINLTALGRVTALPSTFIIPAGHNVLVAILSTGWTGAPQMAARPAVVHTSLLNPNAGLATIMTKAGQTTLPSTINTTDGTWSITGVQTIWAALGGALI